MAPYEHHLNSPQPRLLDGETCKCGSMIICRADFDKESRQARKYGKVSCAFKSQCFDRVVSGEPTEEEEKILKARAESRRKMLDCQLKRCTNGAEGSHQCPYMACKSCCNGQRKLCLTHNDHEVLKVDSQAEGFSGLPAEIWSVKGTPIASGGFAEVYHGRWGSQEVAIKTMKTQDEDSLTLRRNQNELGVWREADHPNLVPLLATIDRDGLKSIVTPFYNNGDLMKYLKLVRYRLLVGAAEGLRYLHDTKNTAHGDLSMGNILVSDSGSGLLSDFGLAVPPSRTGYTTSEGQNGCPQYKAPECFISDRSVSPKARTPASDMWAFGTIIVQVLSDRRPYGGRTAIQKMVEEGRVPFDDDEINSCQMRPDLRDVVRACFNQVPQARPSIGLILEELEKSRRSVANR